MTCKDITDKLNKAKRKYEVCENWRHAKLFCIKCEKLLGEYDMYYHSHEALKYCSDCVNSFKKEVPYEIDYGTIIFDNGVSVDITYKDSYYSSLTVNKQCYFNNKGRYIKIKNKRYFL